MTCDNERTRHADLAWCRALLAANHAVELQRGLDRDTLPLDAQFDVAAALAAGLAAFADEASGAGLTWTETHRLGREELEETTRCRTAHRHS
jgi:hypothetical protein